jgi:hydroxymethylpyrimidine/phosphomethylpyrimidine kinase
MLYSSAIVRTVAECLRGYSTCPLVVDPVMISTSGATLLNKSAQKALRDELLPRACLVTPNLEEAAVLTGKPLRSVEDMRRAARQINERFGCAALVKGGHLRGGREAIDIFVDDEVELLLTAPFVRGVSTHGTGCTYSAAITAYLGQGRSLHTSVENAKQFISMAVANSYAIGQHQALGIAS